jgi:hypothetical protein
MRRSIYISRSLLDEQRGGIPSLIYSSAGRNELAGITGLLWIGKGWFAQVLEGSPHAIEATMKRIRVDHRHTDIDVIFDRDVASRQFGSWSMKQAGDEEASAFMVGFALSQKSASGRRLHEIVLASLEREDRQA